MPLAFKRASQIQVELFFTERENGTFILTSVNPAVSGGDDKDIYYQIQQGLARYYPTVFDQKATAIRFATLDGFRVREK